MGATSAARRPQSIRTSTPALRRRALRGLPRRPAAGGEGSAQGRLPPAQGNLASGACRAARLDGRSPRVAAGAPEPARRQPLQL